jgi:acyl-CoA synthetase (AMP-forming)/AMP-acid ligase II/acyl carrier protein
MNADIARGDTTVVDLEHGAGRQPQTFSEILQRRAREQPERVGYVYRSGDELESELTLTYGELDRRAGTVAAALRQTCEPGDRAVLLYPPGLDFIPAFFGCLYAGVVAVPAYPPRASRGLDRLQSIVADCRATVALTTEDLGRGIQPHSLAAAELAAMRWIETDGFPASSGTTWAAEPRAAEALAFLQYTSGSTGTPKGVMVSHQNLIHNSQCVRDRWEHSAKSMGVSWLPQFHDMGLIIGLLQPLYVGYQAVLLSPASFIQNPYRWLETISRYRGTTTSAPNFAFDLCALKVTPEQREKLDLSCLETVINGAEPVVLDTLKRFEHAFAPCGFKMRAFRGGYGLAEGTVFVTTSRRSPGGPKVMTLSRTALEQHRVVSVPAGAPDAQDIVGCGPTAEDQEIVIVKADRDTRCHPDQIGEIWVKGPSVAGGYWQRSAETAATFQAVLEDTKEGPFLRTGDLGFLHDNELFVTGRMKDLIIVRGRNHYPQDLERTVERVHPCLRPSCTAAFSVRDGAEERVVLVQEIRRHHREVDLDQLLADIFQAVAREHELSLHAILLIAEGDISKTSSGKIQRSMCRQRYENGGFKIVRQAAFAISPRQPELNSASFLSRLYQLDADECRTQVQSYLVQMLRAVRPDFLYIDVHQSLVRIGLDSLVAAELRNAIERDLGIAVPHTLLMETSIRDLSEELIRQLTTRSARSGDGTAHPNGVDALSDAEVNSLLAEMLSATGSKHG